MLERSGSDILEFLNRPNPNLLQTIVPALDQEVLDDRSVEYRERIIPMDVLFTGPANTVSGVLASMLLAEAAPAIFVFGADGIPEESVGNEFSYDNCRMKSTYYDHDGTLSWKQNTWQLYTDGVRMNSMMPPMLEEIREVIGHDPVPIYNCSVSSQIDNLPCISVDEGIDRILALASRRSPSPPESGRPRRARGQQPARPLRPE